MFPCFSLGRSLERSRNRIKGDRFKEFCATSRDCQLRHSKKCQTASTDILAYHMSIIYYISNFAKQSYTFMLIVL